MPARSGDDPEFNDIATKPRSGRRFRFFELAMGLGVVLLLIGLLLPLRRTSGEAARRTQCASNLRQIGLALLSYEQAHKVLPPAYTVDPEGRPLHSWRTLILPYLDEHELYRTIDLAKPWNDPANSRALGAMPSVFQCPSATGAEDTTTYLAIVAPDGLFSPGGPRRLAEITDPHGTTLMAIEAGEENAAPWMAPVDADESLVINLGPKTKHHHPGGSNACFADGSVKFLADSISAEVRRALMTISGKDNEVARDL